MNRPYTMNTLLENRVINPLVTEVTRQAAYDYALYPAAGQTSFSFFQNPIGQGVTSAVGATVGGVKTYADTNMTNAGMFPKPQAMVVESLEVSFEPGSSAAASTFVPADVSVFAAANAAAVLASLNDVNTIRQSGWLEWFIGTKTYLWEAPIGRFPAKVGMELKAAIATTSATAGEVAAAYAQHSGKIYMVSPEITLDSLVNFSVNLKFPNAVATPSGKNGRIGVILDGVLYRNGQ